MWYFRAIQLEDGHWACRRGLHEFDVHEELEAAVEHLRALAKEFTPSTLYIHDLDGTIEGPYLT